MNSVKKICVEDIDCLNFWINYFSCYYQNGYNELNDISVSEHIEDLYTEKVQNWWEQFTRYYEDVLDESDGYLDNPTTLEEEMPSVREKITDEKLFRGRLMKKCFWMYCGRIL